MAKEKLFKGEYLDEKRFAQLCSQFDEVADKVMGGILALQSEGIPTDKKMIETITKTPESFRDYIRGLAQEKIGNGFIPIDERSRIISDFNGILNRINGKVQVMRESLPKVAIKQSGGIIAVDLDEAKKNAEKECTVYVDSEAMEAYYNQVLLLKKAVEAFRAYEKENNLPSFEAGLWYGNFSKMTIQSFCDKKNADAELFQTLTAQLFKK